MARVELGTGRRWSNVLSTTTIPLLCCSCLRACSQNDPAYYIPAWGGFCSYGIAHEVVENVGILGPAADPGHWWIEDEVLYLFRRCVFQNGFVRVFALY